MVELMKKEKNTVINALVVDDNEVNAMILANMLELFKIHVDQAYQGMKAVILSKKKRYDIIFIDHIMPKMDGVQTVNAIRKLSFYHQKSVIIVLTANITEQLKNRYQSVGANEICAKPLQLLDLITLLKKWFHLDQTEAVLTNEENVFSDENNDNIKVLLEIINDINYSEGIQYAIGDPKRFIKILEVSLKDLQSCKNIIIKSHELNSLKQLQIGIHKLKGIFSNIGAIKMTESISTFEKSMLEGVNKKINIQYDSFLNELEHFIEKLSKVLDKYFLSIKQMETDQEPVNPMSDYEYEQSLLNTIYYIRRYEYDSCIRELEHLTSKGRQEDRQEIERALKNIINFDYENALDRMLQIKNKTGNLPA